MSLLEKYWGVKMINELILQQKIASRKAIAKLKVMLTGASLALRKDILLAIAKEREFLRLDSASIKDISDFAKHASGRYKIRVAEEPINLPGAPAEDVTENPEGDFRPTYGNLIDVLNREVQEEKSRMDSMKLPSQNDLRRWALKDATLAYYQSLNLPPNTKVLDTSLDHRLTSDLAPDFDVIYKMWLDRLRGLIDRDDKYALEEREFGEAEKDVMENETGMRGSAFEKQLDRYRADFVERLFE